MQYKQGKKEKVKNAAALILKYRSPNDTEVETCHDPQVKAFINQLGLSMAEIIQDEALA